MSRTERSAMLGPAVAARVERWVRPLKCSRPRCNGKMSQGVAMQQTYSGSPDFHGGEVVTMSPGGPGRLIGCWKCAACGWSVADGA